MYLSHYYFMSKKILRNLFVIWSVYPRLIKTNRSVGFHLIATHPTVIVRYIVRFLVSN